MCQSEKTVQEERREPVRDSACGWANADALSRAYHDRRWGVPERDDRALFEMLSLEAFQCGLSWRIVLAKRESLAKAFEGFDFEKVAAYGEDDVRRVLAAEGVIRSERKVRAVIANAKAFLAVRAKCGSFASFLWGHTRGKTLVYDGHASGRIPASNALSARIARELKGWGFAYVGPTVVYAFLQAAGLINDHGADCPRFAAINRSHPVLKVEPEGEVFAR